MDSREKLLEIKGLETYFNTEDGVAKAVNGVDYHVYKGETLGVVGESGSGKSVTSLSIMRLIPNPPGFIAGGQILFDGKDLLQLSYEEMRKVRGNQISMIFQEPMTSLNPVFTIGNQIMEPIILHEKLFLKIVKLSFQQRRKTIRNSLKQINLSDNLREDIIFDKRPEQLSVNEFIDLTNLVSHDLNN